MLAIIRSIDTSIRAIDTVIRSTDTTIIPSDAILPPSDPRPPPDQDKPPPTDNLLYCNNNPEGDPCPICKPDIGRVFTPGTERRVPRHKHCYCYYRPTLRPSPPTR